MKSDQSQSHLALFPRNPRTLRYTTAGNLVASSPGSTHLYFPESLDAVGPPLSHGNVRRTKLAQNANQTDRHGLRCGRRALHCNGCRRGDVRPWRRARLGNGRHRHGVCRERRKLERSSELRIAQCAGNVLEGSQSRLLIRIVNVALDNHNPQDQRGTLKPPGYSPRLQLSS